MKDAIAKTEQAYRTAISGLSPGRRIVMIADMYGDPSAFVYAGIRRSTKRGQTPARLREKLISLDVRSGLQPSSHQEDLAGLSGAPDKPSDARSWT